MQDNPSPILTNFEQLLGRTPSASEIEHLYNIKNALGIRDNDAMWIIIMAMESYFVQLNRLPDIHSRKMEETLQSYQHACESITRAEAQKNIATLTDQVHRTCESVLSAQTQGVRMAAQAWIIMGLILMGSICFIAGIIIGSGRLPFWLDVPYTQSLGGFILAMIAQTPAGWILAITGCLLSLNLLCQHGFEMKGHRKPALVIGALCLFGLSLCFMLPLL